MIYVSYGDGYAAECLGISRAHVQKWADHWRVRFAPVFGGCPDHPGGGDPCWKKLWPAKEICGYEGQGPSDLNAVQLRTGLKADEGELIIVADADTIIMQPKLADPNWLEKELGDKDIGCLIEQNRWLNLGVFCFRNTSKMRAYLDTVWNGPALKKDEIDPTLKGMMLKWYKDRWKATEEMTISQHVLEGKLTAAQIDGRWNQCSGEHQNFYEKECYIRHWPMIPDKSTVARRMTDALFKVGAW